MMVDTICMEIFLKSCVTIGPPAEPVNRFFFFKKSMNICDNFYLKKIVCVHLVRGNVTINQNIPNISRIKNNIDRNIHIFL